MKSPLLRRALTGFLCLVMVLSCTPAALAIEPPDDVQCTPEESHQIWNFLMDLTENPVAAAAIMGNLFYESHLVSTNLETMKKTPPPMSDEEYAIAVDLGEYEKFTTDGFGFGLCQWTYPDRKARVLEKAKEQKKSVGDLTVQLEVLGEELEKYRMLYRISHEGSIRAASDYFLKNFENPQDQSEAVKVKRWKKGQEFYEKYTTPPKAGELTDLQKAVVNVATHSEAYGIKALKGKSQKWAADVYAILGLPKDPSKNAAESAASYGIGEDFTIIPVGAAVYGHASGREGCVAIYVGENQVYYNEGGKIKSDKLSDWVANYRGFCWGWIGGNDLTETEEDKK